MAIRCSRDRVGETATVLDHAANVPVLRDVGALDRDATRIGSRSRTPHCGPEGVGAGPQLRGGHDGGRLADFPRGALEHPSGRLGEVSERLEQHLAVVGPGLRRGPCRLTDSKPHQIVAEVVEIVLGVRSVEFQRDGVDEQPASRADLDVEGTERAVHLGQVPPGLPAPPGRGDPPVAPLVVGDLQPRRALALRPQGGRLHVDERAREMDAEPRREVAEDRHFGTHAAVQRLLDLDGMCRDDHLARRALRFPFDLEIVRQHVHRPVSAASN